MVEDRTDGGARPVSHPIVSRRLPEAYPALCFVELLQLRHTWCSFACRLNLLTALTTFAISRDTKLFTFITKLPGQFRDGKGTEQSKRIAKALVVMVYAVKALSGRREHASAIRQPQCQSRGNPSTPALGEVIGDPCPHLSYPEPPAGQSACAMGLGIQTDLDVHVALLQDPS